MTYFARHLFFFPLKLASNPSLLALQDARFSARGKIWDKSGRRSWEGGRCSYFPAGEEMLTGALVTRACSHARYFFTIAKPSI